MNAQNEKIYRLIGEMHKDADYELDFGSPFQLRVAVIL